MEKASKEYSPHGKNWLKIFFVLHFIIDISIAIPLFIAPVFFWKIWVGKLLILLLPAW